MRSLFTIQLAERADVHLVCIPREQLESLASLAEMVLDGSGCTFGDWGDANPDKVAGLEEAYNAIDDLLKDTK